MTIAYAIRYDDEALTEMIVHGWCVTDQDDIDDILKRLTEADVEYVILHEINRIIGRAIEQLGVKSDG